MGFTRTPEMLEDICQSYLLEIRRLQDKIKKLEKENKELEKKLDYYKRRYSFPIRERGP